ncbi:hypothetical protein K6W16_13935 [Burkholderia dolosa]|uniref:Tail fiber protein n=1 Tax=Burkholderia dolosa TaxID=152500 RepID=A0A892I679_9BURK|nr:MULTISPECIES: hypothetical protein [Burkholderia]AKE03754.1 hypothetical protein XM57_12830 [Burkholderia cepacia]AJY12051.1 hypothetical protein AK34_1525 [Burkholderia dolosa AU0158]AYZ98519.1 hypothetical protein EGY28_26945 [Burkholderia dolosa]MBR8418914.1 hypothetical protein [Burkholderia dolosa]MBY4658443.1 hypothetical protein [Burkholderia dolosa]
MGINNFKPFAAAGGANVMSQADYEALAALLTGFQSGTAQSQQLNKVWRQSSIMSAVLAQFIVDLTGQDAIDDGTTATLLANLKTAVQVQSAAVVGQARNLTMSVMSASSTATLTADEIIVGAALGGQKYVLKQFSKTINLASTGLGGMDTGSAPASGFVALYAIYNPATQTAALLATNAATKQGNVYGGANMPAGYTASALVAVWPTNASGQFAIGALNDRTFYMVRLAALNTAVSAPTLTPVNLAALVPVNAREVFGDISGATTGGTSATIQLAIGANSSNIGGINPTYSSVGQVYYKIPMVTPQTAWYIVSTTSGTVSFQINVAGYTF